MSRPIDHYEDLLADHYTWMLGGDLEQLASAELPVLQAAGVRRSSIAVDLGCGPGPQTLALADLGFDRVIGIDTSRQLLEELVSHSVSRPAVEAVEMDLAEALPDGLEGTRPDVVVCMRDTLLHLSDRDAVTSLRGASGWELHKSSYQKLRLAPEWIADELRAVGLTVDHHEPGPTGMWTTAGMHTGA